MKYRCPHCGENGLSVIEHCGIWVSTRFLTGKRFGRYCCTECYKSAELLYGKIGWGISFVVSYVLPCAVMMCLGAEAILRENPDIAVFGIPFTVLVMSLFNLLFGHFDKGAKRERDADARLTFAVMEAGARVKKWTIYLLRFPKRGTNAHSPVMYGMVCRKSGKKGERALTLRVIRADHMDLPDIGEPVLLVTRTNKVVEGTVITTAPKKEVYSPYE